MFQKKHLRLKFTKLLQNAQMFWIIEFTFQESTGYRKDSIDIKNFDEMKISPNDGWLIHAPTVISGRLPARHITRIG